MSSCWNTKHLAYHQTRALDYCENNTQLRKMLTGRQQHARSILSLKQSNPSVMVGPVNYFLILSEALTICFEYHQDRSLMLGTHMTFITLKEAAFDSAIA